jgi:Ca-activated chloride channel family protein
MVAELAAVAVCMVAASAELWHARRVRRVSRLAFGPSERPAAWARSAPLLRVAALTAAAWGLTTLLILEPRVHRAKVLPESEYRHVVLCLDVSPSMRLQDAGPKHDQSRTKRAADVLESFFKRVAIEQYRISVVAFYTGAKPVVEDTRDIEVVRNILHDLPMQYAFRSGQTDLFAGLDEAARLARRWKPRSTTVIVVSDGDTVAATRMPKMPASVVAVLLVGLGDPRTGKFIDGRQSRQEVSVLRQTAVRLSGAYHDGNEKHLPTELLQRLTATARVSQFERLTRREYALIASGTGAGTYALLPLLLHLAGTRWRPGTPVRRLESAVRHRPGATPHPIGGRSM